MHRPLPIAGWVLCLTALIGASQDRRPDPPQFRAGVELTLKELRAAFDAGRALGAQDNPWQSTPPNSGDIPAWAFGMMAPVTSGSAP